MVAARLQFREGEELKVADGVFAREDAGGFDVDQVDDAEVDAADVVAVVVEEGDGALAVVAGDGEFLVEFPFDGAAVGCFVEVGGVRVAVIDVSADSEGKFGRGRGRRSAG